MQEQDRRQEKGKGEKTNDQRKQGKENYRKENGNVE